MCRGVRSAQEGGREGARDGEKEGERKEGHEQEIVKKGESNKYSASIKDTLKASVFAALCDLNQVQVAYFFAGHHFRGAVKHPIPLHLPTWIGGILSTQTTPMYLMKNRTVAVKLVACMRMHCCR